MSVDNYAILMVGLKDAEVDLSKLPDMTQEMYDEINGDLWAYSRERENLFDGLRLETTTDNGYSRRCRFIGFVIKRTDSYDFEEIDFESFQDSVRKAFSVFYRIFEVSPKVLLIEYQD